MTNSGLELCDRIDVRNALTPVEFSARLPEVADHLDFLQQSLVVRHIENDGGTLPVLGEDERTL